MRVVGVDENGLGPVLGPLVATAVTVETGRYDATRCRRIGARLGITDSKETSAFGQMAHAEGVALAVLERLHGRAPVDADELLGQLSLDGAAALRSPCPSGQAPRQCWGEAVELPAFGGELDAGRRVLDRLVRRGIVPRRARSALACAAVLNRERSRGRSKVVVDLSLFERLLLDARADSSEEPLAVCGMVGGIRHYPQHLTHLADREIEPRGRNRMRSVYRIEGVGEVRFEVGADGRHLPVGLASMVGKYVREVAMERLTRFYRRHDAELPAVSGYRDPVTRRFVSRTEPLRRRLAIADDCFERQA